MAISRRLFVSTGLLCVVGVWYVKGLPSFNGLPILSNNIESFFESYELNREKVIPGHSQAVIFIGPLKAGIYPFFGEFFPKTAQGKVLVK